MSLTPAVSVSRRMRLKYPISLGWNMAMAVPDLPARPVRPAEVGRAGWRSAVSSQARNGGVKQAGAGGGTNAVGYRAPTQE